VIAHNKQSSIDRTTLEPPFPFPLHSIPWQQRKNTHGALDLTIQTTQTKAELVSSHYTPYPTLYTSSLETTSIVVTCHSQQSTNTSSHSFVQLEHDH